MEEKSLYDDKIATPGKSTNGEVNGAESDSEDFAKESMEMDQVCPSDSNGIVSGNEMKRFLKAAMESLDTAVPKEISSWALRSFTLSQIPEFTQNIFPRLIENAIDQHIGFVPAELNPSFADLIRIQSQKKWQPILPEILKTSLVYNAKLGVKLDIHNCIDPKNFQIISEEILNTILAEAQEDFTLSATTAACKIIMDSYVSRYKHIFDTRYEADIKLQEVVNNYRIKMSLAVSACRNKHDRIKAHSDLKKESVTKFRGDLNFCDKLLSKQYELKLIGLLNAEYDKIIQEHRRHVAKSKNQVPVSIRNGASNQISQDKKSRMDSMDASPEARQKHSHEPPYRVLKEGDGEIPDKVPGSQILFYERKIISQGSNAIVHHGKFGDDKIGFRPAAIKKFQRKDVKLFENELRIWKEIDESNIHSVNVIKMFGYVEWTTFLFIAIEKAHTDLRNMIVQMRKKISNDITSSQLKQLVGYVHDASKGLNWLHSKDIIHRDIKPDNILICVHSMNGKDIETAKLTDFGVSRIMSDSMGTETSVEGTDDWLAPEVLEAKVAGRSLFNAKPQDIFSLGLTAHFTLSLGDHPFGYRETGGGIVGANILNAEFPPARLPHPHYMANNLIQRMIQRTAAIRPEITSVLKHPLFWNWKTSLHFIAEFASIFGEKHADGTEDFRAKLDQHFKCWYEENVMSEYVENEAAKFDWKSKLDYGKLEAFTKRKSYQESSKDMMEKYDGESLMRLVDFIRDKCMHPGDMMDKLKEVEHFGEDGVFNKEKYAEYFLQTFPYLLLFLVEVYDKHSNTYADLRQLRHYFD